MRFGLALPHYDFSLRDTGPIRFAHTAEWAMRAEEAGFDSVWVSDHFFYSLARYGLGEELLGSLEPMTVLAALARTTSRVRLGTLVLGVPFRHPAILAKSATAIDLLSGGRLDLGLGAGWYEEEFERFGYTFATLGERFSRLEETVAALDELLAGGPVTFEGEYVQFVEAYDHPRPAQQPRPPIWIGAKGGDRALRLAVRHADGWNTVWRWTVDAYAERVRRARELCEEHGRDPATFRLSIGLYSVIGEDKRDLARRWEAMRAWAPGAAIDPLDAFVGDTLSGTVQQVGERIEELAALGVEEIVVSPATLPFAIPDPSMLDILTEAVMPTARAG
jgi:probable F420-dependent oxidoreductase